MKSKRWLRWLAAVLGVVLGFDLGLRFGWVTTAVLLLALGAIIVSVRRWGLRICIWIVVFLLDIRNQVLLARVIIDSNQEEYQRQMAEYRAALGEKSES